MLRTTRINQKNKRAADPGIKEAKEFATAGGTDSGILMTMLRLMKKRIISLEMIATIIAVNIPPEPKVEGSIAKSLFNIHNKKAMAPTAVPVNGSILLALAD